MERTFSPSPEGEGQRSYTLLSQKEEEQRRQLQDVLRRLQKLEELGHAKILSMVMFVTYRS